MIPRSRILSANLVLAGTALCLTVALVLKYPDIPATLPDGFRMLLKGLILCLAASSILLLYGMGWTKDTQESEAA